MHYTYVLLTGSTGRFCTGCSADLRKRVKEHAAYLRTPSRNKLERH